SSGVRELPEGVRVRLTVARADREDLLNLVTSDQIHDLTGQVHLDSIRLVVSLREPGPDVVTEEAVECAAPGGRAGHADLFAERHDRLLGLSAGDSVDRPAIEALCLEPGLEIGDGGGSIGFWWRPGDEAEDERDGQGQVSESAKHVSRLTEARGSRQSLQG